MTQPEQEGGTGRPTAGKEEPVAAVAEPRDPQTRHPRRERERQREESREGGLLDPLPP